MAKKITREALKATLDAGEKVHLVSVLDPGAFQQSHIPGSENVPLVELERRAPELWGHDENIVVYCASYQCKSSGEAARRLEEMGYTDVRDFEGGTLDWKNACYPVETGLGKTA